MADGKPDARGKPAVARHPDSVTLPEAGVIDGLPPRIGVQEMHCQRATSLACLRDTTPSPELSQIHVRMPVISGISRHRRTSYPSHWQGGLWRSQVQVAVKRNAGAGRVEPKAKPNMYCDANKAASAARKHTELYILARNALKHESRLTSGVERRRTSIGPGNSGLWTLDSLQARGGGGNRNVTGGKPAVRQESVKAQESAKPPPDAAYAADPGPRTLPIKPVRDRVNQWPKTALPLSAI
ncbi:hypothetical protein B0H11DRAFT_2421484 [Mycena galericulata]|nr:hypothetical protein B0H11DRAFT_2421484 [Mycena galericulata]